MYKHIQPDPSILVCLFVYVYTHLCSFTGVCLIIIIIVAKQGVTLVAGDLGFLTEGQLFISGRVKDVVVMYGRTIHPSDIEMSIESQFDILRPGRTVACEYADTNNTTGVAYIAELRSWRDNSLADLNSYSMQIAAQISMQFHVNTTLVVLIKHGSMPRTTSGKRQRSLCKKKLLQNSLQEVYRWNLTQESDSVSNASSPSTPHSLQSESSPATKIGPVVETSQPMKTVFIEQESSDSKERKWGHHNVTSQDLIKQFNFEIEEDQGMSLSSIPPADHSEHPTETRRRRHGSVERVFFEIGHNTPTDGQKVTGTLTIPQLPRIEVDDITLPTITDPDTTSPEAKIRRGSTIVPAVTTTSPEVSVKSFSGKPKLTSSCSGNLGVQDNPRRKSAPPHEVSVEGKRIEDDARRKSVQDRKTMMVRKLMERRNSVQTLTKTISKVLGAELEPESNIWAYGCNSLKAIQLSKTLQLDFGFSVEPHLLYTHQTPIALVEHLQRKLLHMPQNPEVPKQKASAEWKTQSLDRNTARRRSSFGLLTDARRMSLPKILSDDGNSMADMSSSKCSLDSEPAGEDTDIAIVGMACSFPGENCTLTHCVD